MVNIISDETSNKIVIEATALEVIEGLRLAVEAAGKTWPDFGAGEGDNVYLRLQDDAGNVAHLDQTTAAMQTLTLTDKEPSA